MTALPNAPEQLLAQLATIATQARVAGVSDDDLARAIGGSSPREIVSLPEITVVVVRDPDQSDEVTIYANNAEIDANTIVIDAGKGWDAHEWHEHAATSIASTSGPLHTHLVETFANPPGSEYITGGDL